MTTPAKRKRQKADLLGMGATIRESTPWRAWDAHRKSVANYPTWSPREKLICASGFMAGYRAGKEAK